MSKQIFKGKGKLYEAGGEQSIASVNYEVWKKPQTEDSPEEWGGDFTTEHIIWPSGEYILELKDGRRVSCLIHVEESLHEEYPTLFHYGLTVIGTLEE